MPRPTLSDRPAPESAPPASPLCGPAQAAPGPRSLSPPGPRRPRKTPRSSATLGSRPSLRTCYLSREGMTSPGRACHPSRPVPALASHSTLLHASLFARLPCTHLLSTHPRPNPRLSTRTRERHQHQLPCVGVRRPAAHQDVQRHHGCNEAGRRGAGGLEHAGHTGGVGGLRFGSCTVMEQMGAGGTLGRHKVLRRRMGRVLGGCAGHTGVL